MSQCLKLIICWGCCLRLLVFFEFVDIHSLMDVPWVDNTKISSHVFVSIFRYGDITCLQLGRRMIIMISSPSLVKELIVKQADVTSNRSAPPFFTSVMDYKGTSSTVCHYHYKHDRQDFRGINPRRILIPVFWYSMEIMFGLLNTSLFALFDGRWQGQAYRNCLNLIFRKSLRLCSHKFLLIQVCGF